MLTVESQPQQKYYSLFFEKLSPPFDSLDWKVSGFQTFVRETLRPYESEHRAELSNWNWLVLPDAWHHDSETHHVTLLEIVEANDISNEKSCRLANLFWLLDIAECYTSVLLFYPKTSTTLIVDRLSSLDAIAKDLKGRRTPYRDAFESLKVAVAA